MNVNELQKVSSLERNDTDSLFRVQNLPTLSTKENEPKDIHQSTTGFKSATIIASDSNCKHKAVSKLEDSCRNFEHFKKIGRFRSNSELVRENVESISKKGLKSDTLKKGLKLCKSLKIGNSKNLSSRETKKSDSELRRLSSKPYKRQTTSSLCFETTCDSTVNDTPNVISRPGDHKKNFKSSTLGNEPLMKLNYSSKAFNYSKISCSEENSSSHSGYAQNKYKHRHTTNPDLRSYCEDLLNKSINLEPNKHEGEKSYSVTSDYSGSPNQTRDHISFFNYEADIKPVNSPISQKPSNSTYSIPHDNKISCHQSHSAHPGSDIQKIQVTASPSTSRPNPTAGNKNKSYKFGELEFICDRLSQTTYISRSTSGGKSISQIIKMNESMSSNDSIRVKRPELEVHPPLIRAKSEVNYECLKQQKEKNCDKPQVPGFSQSKKIKAITAYSSSRKDIRSPKSIEPSVDHNYGRQNSNSYSLQKKYPNENIDSPLLRPTSVESFLLKRRKYLPPPLISRLSTTESPPLSPKISSEPCNAFPILSVSPTSKEGNLSVTDEDIENKIYNVCDKKSKLINSSLRENFNYSALPSNLIPKVTEPDHRTKITFPTQDLPTLPKKVKSPPIKFFIGSPLSRMMKPGKSTPSKRFRSYSLDSSGYSSSSHTNMHSVNAMITGDDMLTKKLEHKTGVQCRSLSFDSPSKSVNNKKENLPNSDSHCKNHPKSSREYTSYFHRASPNTQKHNRNRPSTNSNADSGIDKSKHIPKRRFSDSIEGSFLPREQKSNPSCQKQVPSQSFINTKKEHQQRGHTNSDKQDPPQLVSAKQPESLNKRPKFSDTGVQIRQKIVCFQDTEFHEQMSDSNHENKECHFSGKLKMGNKYEAIVLPELDVKVAKKKQSIAISLAKALDVHNRKDNLNAYQEDENSTILSQKLPSSSRNDVRFTKGTLTTFECKPKSKSPPIDRKLINEDNRSTPKFSSEAGKKFVPCLCFECFTLNANGLRLLDL